MKSIKFALNLTNEKMAFLAAKSFGACLVLDGEKWQNSGFAAKFFYEVCTF